MKNLPKGMIPDRDNQVYFDTELKQFYMVTWFDTGNSEIPTRHYIENVNIPGFISAFTNIPPKTNFKTETMLLNKTDKN